MPGGLPAPLPVRHALVAPDVVDGVQLPQLGEEASVGNVWSNIGSELDSLGPVVTPVIHGAGLQRVGPDDDDVIVEVNDEASPDIIDVGANPLVRTGPE